MCTWFVRNAQTHLPPPISSITVYWINYTSPQLSTHGPECYYKAKHNYGNHGNHSYTILLYVWFLKSWGKSTSWPQPPPLWLMRSVLLFFSRNPVSAGQATVSRFPQHKGCIISIMAPGVNNLDSLSHSVISAVTCLRLCCSQTFNLIMKLW